MFLKNIVLKNFRNYSDRQFDFCNNFNFITGFNGTGKTNLLEAVSVLSNIKSFRGIADKKLIKQKENHYYIKGLVESNNSENVYEVAFLNSEKVKKKLKIDNEKIDRLADYYGKFLTVCFSPNDTSIINGTPDIKRKYIDSIISKIDKKYFKNICEYRRVLNNRNTLLKNRNIDYKNLEIWDILLAEKSSYIIKCRDNFINRLSSLITEYYNVIGNEKNKIYIDYKPSIQENDKEIIFKKIYNNHKKDTIFKTTTLGPHRDSYSVRYMGEDCSFYASNGQQRSMAIAIRMGEMNIIESVTEKKAVILVDDIFSELDKLRRHNLIRFIHNNNQVIFTVPSVDCFEKEYISDSILYNLNK